MAEPDDEKKVETQYASKDKLKNEIKNEFSEMRELLNEREKKLVKDICNIQSKSSVNVKVVFDTDAVYKLINEFGTIESNDIENKTLKLDSIIVTNENEVGELTKLLIDRLKDNIKLNLLYRSTKDDDTKEEFHNKCDNKGATLTIVETEYCHVFGCFTSIAWSSVKSEYHADESAFIFSLRSSFGHEIPKIYSIENDKYKPKAVYHNLNYGPAFGHGQDIGIEPSGNSWIKSAYSYMLNGNALCGGKEFEDLNRKKRYFFKYNCYEVFNVE